MVGLTLLIPETLLITQGSEKSDKDRKNVSINFNMYYFHNCPLLSKYQEYCNYGGKLAYLCHWTSVWSQLNSGNTDTSARCSSPETHIWLSVKSHICDCAEGQVYFKNHHQKHSFRRKCCLLLGYFFRRIDCLWRFSCWLYLTRSIWHGLQCCHHSMPRLGGMLRVTETPVPWLVTSWPLVTVKQVTTV